MDDWGWEHVARWTEHRIQLPIGQLFCILAGPTRGRGWSATAARGELRRLAIHAGVRRRFAPHQLGHAHAIEMAHEGIPLPIIQRQLGHAHLGITSIYLQGIVTREIVDTVHHRRPPVISASAGLRPKRTTKRDRVIGASRARLNRRTRGPRPRPMGATHDVRQRARRGRRQGPRSCRFASAAAKPSRRRILPLRARGVWRDAPWRLRPSERENRQACSCSDPNRSSVGATSLIVREAEG